HNVPAIGFQPSTLFWSKDLNYHHLNLTALEQFLDQKILPVLHGDGVIDQDQGFNILSSDHLLNLVIKHLSNKPKYIIEKIINLGNYDGVLDNQGQLIGEINNVNYDALKHYIKGSEYLDVSGGMANKIQVLLELAHLGHESWIMNGDKPNILKQLILDGQSIGTRICWLSI
ncbi:MAG: hypothetical protein QNJ46_27925, partial [Leptolyngbyaceae cyanobacterium MO_188.B28]|nr:hypothetical protein [Leptolyngbyaceae cyanobacterium MO_188.B28]